MPRFRLALPVLALLLSLGCAEPPSEQPTADITPEAAPAGPTLVIHGGAGTLRRGEIGDEREAEIRGVLTEALETGHAVLLAEGSALDAVIATIRVLEDSPHFNAGRGAVFTAAGTNELDASLMDGATGEAGAVTGITRVRHPISAARAVMENTPHVFLSGPGAEAVAEQAGLEMVDPSFFRTEQRWRQFLEKQPSFRLEKEAGGAAGAPSLGAPSPGAPSLGTVGAVALDTAGRIAAGTSTGGLSNKMAGRIGDSPILGAGTWADSGCGVSGTGHGESFIKNAVAHDLCARAAYRGIPVAQAAREIVAELEEAGAAAGVIALDGQGNAVMEFNTEGMYRGTIGANGVVSVAIYRGDG